MTILAELLSRARRGEGRGLVWSLVMADLVVRRGESGPLARPWRALPVRPKEPGRRG